MAEWFKARAWKARVPKQHRGFESRSLRHFIINELHRFVYPSVTNLLIPVCRRVEFPFPADRDPLAAEATRILVANGWPI